MSRYAQSNSTYQKAGAKYKDNPDAPKTRLHWSMKVLMGGILLGSLGSLYFRQYLLMSYLEFALLTVGLGLLSLGIQWGWFKRKGWLRGRAGVGVPAFIAYNMLGIGFLAMTVLTGLNRTITFGEIITEEYQVVMLDPNYQVSARHLTVMTLEGNAYDNDPDYRAMPYPTYSFQYGSGYRIIGYETQRGLFGFRVKKGKYLRRDDEWVKQYERFTPERRAEVMAGPALVYHDQWIIH